MPEMRVQIEKETDTIKANSSHLPELEFLQQNR